MSRPHARNCGCPRCRHVRWLAEEPTPVEQRRFTIGLCILATIAGVALNSLYPAERLLGTEPHIERSAR